MLVEQENQEKLTSTFITSETLRLIIKNMLMICIWWWQGMLLMPQPIFDTLDSFPHENARVLMMDPAGRTFDQAFAEELASGTTCFFMWTLRRI